MSFIARFNFPPITIYSIFVGQSTGIHKINSVIYSHVLKVLVLTMVAPFISYYCWYWSNVFDYDWQQHVNCSIWNWYQKLFFCFSANTPEYPLVWTQPTLVILTLRKAVFIDLNNCIWSAYYNISILIIIHSRTSRTYIFQSTVVLRLSLSSQNFTLVYSFDQQHMKRSSPIIQTRTSQKIVPLIPL